MCFRLSTTTNQPSPRVQNCSVCKDAPKSIRRGPVAALVGRFRRETPPRSAAGRADGKCLPYKHLPLRPPRIFPRPHNPQNRHKRILLFALTQPVSPPRTDRPKPRNRPITSRTTPTAWPRNRRSLRPCGQPPAHKLCVRRRCRSYRNGFALVPAAGGSFVVYHLSFGIGPASTRSPPGRG